MNVWTFIYDKHKEKVSVILLYVLSSTGRSPGRQGFKMAVGADGSFEGSIGGGIMEHKFVEMAKTILAETTIQKKDVYKQVHSKDQATNQSGMICSGEQTIFLHKINDNDILAVEKIIQAERDHLGGTVLLSKSGIAYSSDVSNQNYCYENSEDEFL